MSSCEFCEKNFVNDKSVDHHLCTSESTIELNQKATNSNNSSTDISYVKYLEEAFKNLNEKYEALFWEMNLIREGNNEIKIEVSKLRKELEIATNIGSLSSQQTTNDEFMTERRLSKLAEVISAGKLTKSSLPIYNELGSEEDGNKNLKNILASLRCRHIWCTLFIIFVLIGISVTLIITLSTPAEIEDWDSEVSDNSSLMLYTREDWQALPPRKEVKPLKENPPHYVIIAHTAGGNCTSFASCAQKVRDIQLDHMGRDWDDIGMHFLVGGDGAAYTGLGWGKHGSHTIPFNRRSIAIYFIGMFMFDLPPRRQILAAQLLIEEGVKLGKIASDYKLFAHKQVWSTESPGAALIENIKKWPHWTTYEKSDD